MKHSQAIPLWVVMRRNPALAKRNPELFGETERGYFPPQPKEKPVLGHPRHRGAALKLMITKLSESPLEERFFTLWKAMRGPPLERQFKFMPSRRFRLDFFEPKSRVGIEIEGGIFARKPSHSSIKNILRDIEKSNELAYCGITLLRFHSGSVKTSSVKRAIEFCENFK